VAEKTQPINDKGVQDDYQQTIDRLTIDIAEAYSNRGAYYSLLSNFVQAINDYDRAIELDPKYADAFYNRGLAHYHLGEHELAVADYTQAIRFIPDDPWAYFNRAITYRLLPKPEHQNARDDLLKVIELKIEGPDALADAYWALGNTYLDLKQYDDALASYHEYLKLAGDSAKQSIRDTVKQLETYDYSDPNVKSQTAQAD
jgi:tetratricopeptide (TPR) repeat protein